MTKITTRREAAEAELNRALSAQFTNKGPVRELDSMGRLHRTDKPTDDEIREFLMGNRVVMGLEIYSDLGNVTFTNLVNNKCLKRSANFSRYNSNNMYWVTEKAREMYDLPRKIKLACGAEVSYAK